MRSSTSVFSRALALAPAIALQTLLCTGSLVRSWLSPNNVEGLQALEQLGVNDHLEKRQTVNAGGISFNTINTCFTVSLAFFHSY